LAPRKKVLSFRALWTQDWKITGIDITYEYDMIARVKPRLGKHIKPVVIVAWMATGNL
jgi:hypothetical protein